MADVSATEFLESAAKASLQADEAKANGELEKAIRLRRRAATWCSRAMDLLEEDGFER